MTDPETSPAPENRRPQPRVYVASLSDYNNGRLHGAWIDATQDPEAIHADIQAMLARSPMPGAEEYAIHDYELGPLQISEYESIETVAKLAAGIAEHGMVFAGWAQALDRAEWDERLESFEDHYVGEFDSAEAFAAEFLESMGYDLDALGPEELQPYVRFDLDAYTRDLADSHTLWRDEDGTVHVFFE